MTNSSIFTVNANSFVKSLLIAIFTPVIAYILTKLSQDTFDFDWHKIITLGLSAGITYLFKQYFSDEQGKLFKKF